MTRTVKPSILLSLLLGFFLNGCATTNKSATADTNTSASTSIPANASTSDSTSATLLAATSAAAVTTTPATTSASSVSNSPATTSAPASTGVKADNNRKDASESFDGPVFKNAAPADPATFRSKEDPWEPVNRKVFGFNEKVDDYVFRPLANGYRWVMPDPLQIAVGNVFSNLNDIPVTLNNLLQLKFNNALTSSMRVIVNSTLGLAGVADVATGIGLEKHDEDFGQTLGYHGVASGPYIVLPFLGPSSTRDAGGRVLDIATDPVFVGSFFVAPFIGPIVGSTRAADTRAGLLKSEKTVDEAALDKYEFIREAYLQRRRNLVHDGNPPKRKEDEDTE
ncbi:phospholipid-binding lipoprotein MlaA [Nitrosospira sp. Nsp2]|uniref:MlaA family lipoprotein n=1 Tax=Nitrosospira sp. Nsp2 TaxID=136548 RepID=UPI000D4831CE|nr:VacJ family lipoprotein [Nitrosospira sp. Nsp2]PTR14695.1 phospholipid-binding lipoprotein MlaA [Nitrosospira sp. Nsp2]